MLLIALVSVGGFTVLAQRRLRSIGMLESSGATDRHVRLVISANGTVVGLAGAILGFVLGLVVWLAYRPSLEQSSHHVIGVLALSWAVVIAAMVLAVVAAFFAASRPARAITKVPIVQALSGRPATPRQIHRSAVPGIVFLVAAFLLLGYSGSTNGNGKGGAPELLFGIVLLIPGLILLAPFFLSLTAKLARHVPIAPRLALRDLARYRGTLGIRRWRRSASRSSSPSSSCWRRRPATGTSSTTQARTLPQTSSGSWPAIRRQANRLCIATPGVSSCQTRTSRWRRRPPRNSPPAPGRSRKRSVRSSSRSSHRMRK